MAEKIYQSDTSMLVYDDKNFNKHTARGKEMLRQSVERNGFGRSIVVDKNNRIIGGNGMVETANALGKKKIKVIETDGDELVVVKRTDVDLDSKRGREMALADNVTGAVDLEFDEDAMRDVMGEFPDLSFEEWGIDMFPEDTTVQEEEHFVPKPFRSDEAESESDPDPLDVTTPEDSEDVPGNEASPSETPEAHSYVGVFKVGDEIMDAERRFRLVCGMSVVQPPTEARLVIGDYSNEDTSDVPDLVMNDAMVAPDGVPFMALHQSGIIIPDAMRPAPLILIGGETGEEYLNYRRGYSCCTLVKGGRFIGKVLSDVFRYTDLPLGTPKTFSYSPELFSALMQSVTEPEDIVFVPTGDYGGSIFLACIMTGRRVVMDIQRQSNANAIVSAYLTQYDGDTDKIYVYRDGNRYKLSELM